MPLRFFLSILVKEIEVKSWKRCLVAILRRCWWDFLNGRSREASLFPFSPAFLLRAGRRPSLFFHHESDLLLSVGPPGRPTLKCRGFGPTARRGLLYERFSAAGRDGGLISCGGNRGGETEPRRPERISLHRAAPSWRRGNDFTGGSN